MSTSFDARIVDLGEFVSRKEVGDVRGERAALRDELCLALGQLSEVPKPLRLRMIRVAESDEIIARHAIYRASDHDEAGKALSSKLEADRLWLASGLARADLAEKFRPDLDYILDDLMISIWLNSPAHIEFFGGLVTRPEIMRDEDMGAATRSHAAFCLRVLAARRSNVVVPKQYDSELKRDIYAPISFPSIPERVLVSKVNAVVEHRIERAHRSNIGRGNAGGHYYGTVAACAMPYELLGFLTVVEHGGRLQKDEELHPWLAWFRQIAYVKPLDLQTLSSLVDRVIGQAF